MAKKTTKTDVSSNGATSDDSPIKPAKRAVAKLAGSVKKKIKSVLEPKAPEVPATPSSSITGNGQAKPRKNRTAAPAAKAKRGSQGEVASGRRPDIQPHPSYTSEDVALRAYFLSQDRIRFGKPGTAEEDWIEAERQLAEEAASQLVHS